MTLVFSSYLSLSVCPFILPTGFLALILAAVTFRYAKWFEMQIREANASSPDDAAQRLPVLVVGAGPTGLTAAAVLASYGVPVHIIEKKASISKTSKATNLMQRNQELMFALGLQEQLQGLSGNMSRLMVHAYGKCFGPRTMHLRESPFPDVLLCGQHVFELVLAEYLQRLGIQIDFLTSLTKLTQNGAHVVAELRDDNRSEEQSYSYVIGCDGYAGVSRQFSKLDFQPQKTGVGIRQVDCYLQWNRRQTGSQMWLFYFDHGFGAVIPLPNATWRILFVQPKTDLPERDPTIEEMQAKLREVAQDHSATLSFPQWFSYTDLAMGIAPGMVDGRIILAGDVCNPILPNGGQGMNTGISDAFNLGWKLAAIYHHRGPKALLKTYEQERYAVRSALQNAQLSSLKYTTLSTPKIMQSAFRWLAEPALNLGGEYAIAKFFSELSINTRKSCLSLNSFKGSGVMAGDRALDALVVRESAPVRLYDILYKGGWTLLLFTGRNVDHRKRIAIESAVRQLRRPDLKTYIVSTTSFMNSDYDILYDLDEEAHRVYGVFHPTLNLIRPDGHVAVRIKPSNVKALTSYLDIWVPDATQIFSLAAW